MSWLGSFVPMALSVASVVLSFVLGGLGLLLSVRSFLRPLPNALSDHVRLGDRNRERSGPVAADGSDFQGHDRRMVRGSFPVLALHEVRSASGLRSWWRAEVGSI